MIAGLPCKRHETSPLESECTPLWCERVEGDYGSPKRDGHPQQALVVWCLGLEARLLRLVVVGGFLRSSGLPRNPSVDAENGLTALLWRCRLGLEDDAVVP